MDVVKKYAPYLMIVLPAIIFAMAGGAKVMGVPEVTKSFADMGFPVWVGTFVGVAEIAGAIGLFVPRLREYAAGGLSMIMFGAIFYHLQYGGSPLLAIVLFVVMVIVMIRRWPRAEATEGS